MSFGKMNKIVEIRRSTITTDASGFASETLSTILTTRAYREGRHGSERWANLASFSDCTDLFRFRKHPSITVKTTDKILCDNETFDIISIEDVKGKGMYIEALAKSVEGSNGKV